MSAQVCTGLFRAGGGHDVAVQRMEKPPATNHYGHGRDDFVGATKLLARQYITLVRVSLFFVPFPSSTNTPGRFKTAEYDSHTSRASPVTNPGSLEPANPHPPHRHRSRTPPLAVPLVQLFLRDTYELLRSRSAKAILYVFAALRHRFRPRSAVGAAATLDIPKTSH
jgi:hypothetical protein